MMGIRKLALKTELGGWEVNGCCGKWSESKGFGDRAPTCLD